MSTVQKTCLLCGGYGRFDDVECPACDTRGFIVVDENDAPTPSSGRVVDEPAAARRVVAGRAAPRTAARPAPTEHDLQAEWLRGYAKGRDERRAGAHAAGYALGASHVCALNLERRGRRAAVVATLVAFLAGVAAAPTLTALLAGALR